MHWNKTLALTDYNDLIPEAALVNKNREDNPEWMFIHEDAIHRVWEYASMIKFVTEYLPVGSRVLEFGASASKNQASPMAALMGLAGMEVIASDMVPWFGKGLHKQCEIFDLPMEGMLLDSRNMPFKSESVDLVCSISVIEHIERDMEVFKESARVIRPGGYIAFTCDFYNPNGRDIGIYDSERLEERIAFLAEEGFKPIDEPDYSSTENHVFWRAFWNQYYNFARCFLRKKS